MPASSRPAFSRPHQRGDFGLYRGAKFIPLFLVAVKQTCHREGGISGRMLSLGLDRVTSWDARKSRKVYSGQQWQCRGCVGSLLGVDHLVVLLQA